MTPSVLGARENGSKHRQSFFCTKVIVPLELVTLITQQIRAQEEAGAGLVDEETPSGEAASQARAQNGADLGDSAAQHVSGMAPHAEAAAQRAADVAQHAADVAQQVDGLAPHQQDARYAASMAFTPQAVSAPVRAPF